MSHQDASEKPTRPIIGVGGLVVENGHVLLIKRGKPPREGEWSLPGGRQELGETVRQAVAREVREETGLTVDVRGLVDVIDFIQKAADGDPLFHYTLVDFLAIPVGGTLRAGSDAVDARFFSLEEVEALPIWEETKRVIRLAITMAQQGDQNQ